MKYTVVFDFDGVINPYREGWKGIDVITEAPLQGIKEEIARVREHYNVYVVSSRCAEEKGIKAIEDYLKKHGIVVDGITAHKPPALVYFDDRAIKFDGNPNGLLEQIQNFKPWNK